MSGPQHVILFRRLSRAPRLRGSSVMRSTQLADLLAPRLAPEITFSVRPFNALLMRPLAMKMLASRIPRGAICIFVKSAAKGLTAAHLAPLRRRGIVVVHDVVDMPLRRVRPELFDALIAASVTGRAALRDLCAAHGLPDMPVELLHHHYDPRLAGCDRVHRDVFTCGYIGRPQNAYIPEALRGEIRMIGVDVERDFAAALPQIGGFALHYGIRPADQTSDDLDRGYKPFTKGFTAAACDAPILVNRDTDDVVALLGEDYPFLVQSASDCDILAAYRRVRECYGGPIWADAVDKMRRLRAIVEPDALADQMRGIVTRLCRKH